MFKFEALGSTAEMLRISFENVRLQIISDFYHSVKYLNLGMWIFCQHGMRLQPVI